MMRAKLIKPFPPVVVKAGSHQRMKLLRQMMIRMMHSYIIEVLTNL